MKLMELTGIKHLKDKTPDELLDFVKSITSDGKSSLKLLGTGAYAIALTDGKQAFKFWHRDSAYEAFVEYCLRHTNNPLLPKFYGKIKHLDLNFKSEGREGVNYIRLELLDTKGLSGEDFDLPYIPKVKGLDQPLNMMQVFDYISSSNPETLTINEVISAMNDMYIDEYDIAPASLRGRKSQTNPDIINLITTVIDIYKTVGASFFVDLHMGNFAKRGNKLVLIDPIASTSDGYIMSTIINIASKLR